MKVKELAEAFDTTVDTVRYYSRIGLITPTKNPVNGYKVYDRKARERLKFILSARQLDFSVEDIKKIISVSDHGNIPCPLVKGILEQRLEETEKRFQATLQLRKKLRETLIDWQNKPDIVPTGNMVCHLIEGEAYSAGEDDE
ncbi:MerR family transcriptional regulator [Algibacillus agarilyticus]|uniref:MerR family transcriptional regulator n=1 Tax=Algibacillus agarilyticus TaxID=2234133 RepID=UPI000DCF83E2|nr:MerR family DNA-binding protein [Algibacillus agarilyticus]